jgi:type II secretory pathway predicted ATPase ExeA
LTTCGGTSSPACEDNPLLTDVMAHLALTKNLHQVGYFATDHHHQLRNDLKAALRQGGLVALTGVGGSGKTVLLWQL